MTKHVHMYTLIDIVREHDPALEMLAHDETAKPDEGDIVFLDNRLAPGDRIIIDDGPIRWYATAGYLGSWPLDADGNATVPYSQHRVVEMIHTGIRGEGAIKPRLLGLADAIIEAVEEARINISDDDRSELIAACQRLRDAAIHASRI